MVAVSNTTLELKGSVHKPLNVHKVSFSRKQRSKFFLSFIEIVSVNSEDFIERNIPFDSDYDIDYGYVFLAFFSVEIC